MATAPKKTTARTAVKKSRYATLRDQARAKHKANAKEPYVFDAVDPPILITPPDSVERITAIAELIDRNGVPDVSELRRLMAAICGDAYDAVWAQIKNEPFELLYDVVADINDHFNAVPADEGDELPGGA